MCQFPEKQFPEKRPVPCLIGMDYLRQAKLVLLISEKGIVLIGEERLAKGFRIKVKPIKSQN